ncbi:MAG: DNA internalization-related competence protein ComEC/Rec2 [Proteobacteria bacterium]|jgi:competence protein ComEC|nr:DNA internalization-related competence protein ComEC/Rec2 [Pseudomonadota bacterium]
MRTGIVLMALGVVFLALAPDVPDAVFVCFLPVCMLLAWLNKALRPVALFACGFLWALLHAHYTLMATLPASLEGRVLVVDGIVAGLPRADEGRLRFDFNVSEARRDGRPVGLRGRLRLSWYQHAPLVQPGQQWQLAVRLKRPRGLVNPGGMDYERWLFRHGITATGYVLSTAGNRLTGADGPAGLDGLRHELAGAIGSRLAGHASGAIITALAVGARGAMSSEQWQTLRATGTSHLMAISGLHIGLVAGLAYLIVIRLWAAAGTPVLLLAAPQAAAAVAMLAGFVYAGLAGFALPTQRALVMLAVIMAAVILRRRVAPSTSLCLALAVVLVFDPFAVLSAGLWLSFGAVAAILLGMNGHIRGIRQARWRRLWWRWGRVQWLVAVGLLPVTIGWFLEYPLIAPAANLVAVPWAGFVLVPVALAAAALLLPFPAIGGALLEAARWAADVLWQFLDALAGVDLILRPYGAPPATAVAAACVGAVLLIAPRGFPGRILGVIWLLPLLSFPVPRPEHGDYWLTLLDVGQGLAAVVRTRSHVLIYDTGPRYGSGFDAGGDVIAPYLQHRGIGAVDMLIVSHRHNDHAGGVEGLLAAVPAAHTMTNVDTVPGQATACLAGTRWQWDGVDFSILHPYSRDAGDGNDGSCMLKVAAPGGRLVLPGDVEELGEADVVSREKQSLQAEVLVVAHHGGRSSTSEAFLEAVSPRIALLGVGYRNRYRFPHADVIRRLTDRGVEIFDTARHGAISLRFDGRVGILGPRLERVESRRIWRSRD